MSSTCPLDSADPFPRTGRIAGIDYGTVRIGVAVTDPEQRFASPLENYSRRDQAADAAWFMRLAADERLVGFVVGLPVHTDGNESHKSVEARDFGKWLAEITGLSVRYFDERYTSAHAEALLQEAGFTSKRRKERLDKLAAQLMLTAYLESSRQGEGSGAL
ncbi:MAG: Holliday junction resolvase RuvX [Planctomycetaceae bacterium]|nr:Holliday junction resolvase RuvX [Planctomycetaceae bacterium]